MTATHDPAAAAEPALGQALARVELALRAGRIGTYEWDLACGTVSPDPLSAELLGFGGLGSVDLGAVVERVHPDDRDHAETTLRSVARDETDTYDTEFRYVLPGGEERWLRCVGRREPDREPGRVVGVVTDITGRRVAELERETAREAERAARDAAAASQRRLQMLARAASLLDSPLDLDLTLQQVADLAIAELADWCAVDLVDDGSIRHAAVAHRDPAMVALAHELQARYPADLEQPAMRHLLDTLEPMYVPEVTDELVVAGARDEEHLAISRSLDMSSAVVVPLQSRDHAVGIMTLVACGGRRLTTEDRDLALELGRRAGSAVEKAKLYAERDRVARTLQRSLLPPRLPDVPGVSLAAHYRPADTGVDIGGDFYDVFRTHGDQWWVVLGDVCGKGAEAAALTGAVRYVLRAVTLDHDDPGLALGRLNEALLGEDWGGRFATALLLSFRADADGELEVRLASGGHPSPVVARASGEAETFPLRGALLGVIEHGAPRTASLRLGGGDSLLLYTDGATEARRPDGSELGEEHLLELLANGPSGAQALVDHVAEGLVRATGPRGLRDDLALLCLTRDAG